MDMMGTCTLPELLVSWEVFHGVFTLRPGVTFPSGDMQQRLVRSLYQEANIPPEQVEYIEAHGTGTKVSQDTDKRGEPRIWVSVWVFFF